MADVVGRNAARAKVLLLKGKDAQQARDVSPHAMYTAFPPCPDLWSYQVNDRNPHPAELGGQPQVKIGAIRQDCQTRTLPFGSGRQFPKLFIDSWNVGHY